MQASTLGSKNNSVMNWLVSSQKPPGGEQPSSVTVHLAFLVLMALLCGFRQITRSLPSHQSKGGEVLTLQAKKVRL